MALSISIATMSLSNSSCRRVAAFVDLLTSSAGLKLLAQSWGIWQMIVPIPPA